MAASEESIVQWSRMLVPVCLLAGGAMPLAHAQVERSGSADARVVQQLQQLTGERAALQAENTKLKAELEQLKQEAAKATSAKTAAETRARALEAGASRDAQSGKLAEEQLERTRTQLTELIAKFRETAQTLRDVEAERSGAKAQLTARERELTACIDRNAA